MHSDLCNTRITPFTERICTGQARSRSGLDVVLGSDHDVVSFAPFSHDAESDGHKDPEPATFNLLGGGISGSLSSTAGDG